MLKRGYGTGGIFENSLQVCNGLGEGRPDCREVHAGTECTQHAADKGNSMHKPFIQPVGCRLIMGYLKLSETDQPVRRLLDSLQKTPQAGGGDGEVFYHICIQYTETSTAAVVTDFSVAAEYPSAAYDRYCVGALIIPEQGAV